MKKTLIGLFLIIVCLFQTNYINGQVNIQSSLIKTSETIVKYKLENLTIKYSLIPTGYIENSVIYQFVDYTDWHIQFYLLNENEYTFQKIFNDITLKGRELYFFSILDSLIFYRKRFSNLINDGYISLYIQTKKNIFTLDSIYNADKKIHSSFSADGKILIVNTLNTLSDYYNPEQDDRFMVYYLGSINVGKIKREYIPCTHCADGYLIGKDLFFTKSNIRDNFSGGFAWKDIYKAPWGKLQDSVKIAAFSEIIAISPDGKYILGTRHFDLPNSPCAIFDVENKKYQLLLGRNYSKAHAFYSYKEKKFAFDFGGWLVYVDFPKEFPFDALRKDNPDIPRWSNKEFYKQFELPPFETNK